MPATVSPTLERRASPVIRATVLIGAVGAGLFGWAVAGPLAGADFIIRLSPSTSPRHIGPTDIAVAALLAGLAAWLFLALLEWWTPKARPVWTVSALLVLAISLIGPFDARSTGTVIALICLHLLVGGVLIGGLRLSSPASIGVSASSASSSGKTVSPSA